MSTLLLSALLLAGWPTLDTPAPSNGQGQNDAALVIGVENYATAPAVVGAVANANAWYLYLTRTRGVPPANVTLLRNNEATLEKMRKFAGQTAQAGKTGGTTWLVFVGHGAPAPNGKDGVLVGFDAQQDADSLFARSIPQSEIMGLLSKGSQARTVAIIDACFSGRTSSGASLVPGLQPLVAMVNAAKPSANSFVFTAAKSDQFAGPLPGVKRPAFSYLMLGAFRGWADGDHNGAITAKEAIDYVRDTLQAVVRDRSQTPELTAQSAAEVLALGKENGPDVTSIVLGDAAPVVEDKPATPVVQPPAPAQTTAGAYAVGQAVSINWKNTWYKGVIRKAQGELYFIHYDGYADSWDEWVGPDRLKAVITAGGSYNVGNNVKVEWKGRWYPASVLEVRGGTYFIHYTGYGSNWDEWVGPDRISPP